MIKGSFPISKVLVFEGNSYVCWKNAHGKESSFPIQKFYEGNICWKNEDIDYFMIAHGKECD